MMKRTALTIIILLALAGLTSSSSKNKSKSMHYTNYPSYTEMWNEVEKFESEDLPRSALEVVEKIYLKARADNNPPQTYKSLVYRSKYNMVLEEDAHLSIVEDFKKEIAEAEMPAKALLQSALAELYWQYFNANRWRFMQRTTTNPDFKPGDFRTWDLQKIFDETASLYDASLMDKSNLSTEDIEGYTDILLTENYKDGNGDNSRSLRPSLYDLLAHRAIQFYQNDITGLTQPAYQFQINDEQAFAPAKDFAKASFDSRDTSSMKRKALLIYQQLIDHHVETKNTDALVDVDLQRLQFVYTIARLSEKDELYEKALTDLLNKYKKEEGAAIAYQLAQFYSQQGDGFNAIEPDEKIQWLKKKAYDLATKYASKYPQSIGGKNCSALAAQISQPNLYLTDELHVMPNKANKLLVNYKNLNNLYFALTKITPDQWNEIRKLNYNTRQTYFKNLRTDITWQVDIDNPGDYQQHSFEAKYPELSSGIYLVRSSTDKDFEKSRARGYSIVHSSPLSYFTKTDYAGTTIYVRDRITGKAVSNVKITVKKQVRNRDQVYILKTVKTATTDSEGKALIQIGNRQDHYGLQLEMEHAGHTNYFINYRYGQSQKPKERWNDRAFVFTDRSIYRPGQVLYFKAIALESNGRQSELLTGKKYEVVLRDANNQEVNKLNLTTNDYGSLSGEFILPDDRLNGQFSIRIGKIGTHYFSVEEYKRPKFKPEFTPIEGNFKLGDEITVVGEAKAYAGSNITDASVVYRVTRQAYFPYPWWGRYSYWRPYPVNNPVEIAHGETTTDETGKFEITFEAIPDKSIDEETLPVFNYTVYADVIDLNGETRSTETVVRVGYTAMELDVDVTDPLTDSTADGQFTVSSKNLNGEPVETVGNLKVFKLKAPDNVVRTRPWQAGDQHIIDKAEFERLFPYESYTNLDDHRKWERGEEVISKKFKTDVEKGLDSLELKRLNRWESGWYVAEAEAKDAFGKDIKAEKYFFFTNTKSKKVADNQLFTIETDKAEYQPGETATLIVGSAAGELNVRLEVFVGDNLIRTEELTINNELQTINLPIKEEHRGNLSVNWGFVWNNSAQTGSETISVPFKPHDLTIETATFRDKLKPGDEETWTFTIKGPKGEKVAAEMLAGMYDASLDQFKGHNWYFSPAVNRINYNRFSFRPWSFDTGRYNIWNDWNSHANYAYQAYDQLDWFGFYFGQSSYMIRERAVYAPVPPGEVEEVVVTGYGGKKEKRAMAVEASDADMLATDGVTPAPPSPPPGQDTKEQMPEDLSEVVTRKNLQETAFFFPQLSTDKDGNVSFSFTTPEALTEWNVMALAHTKELNTGRYSGSVVTQKELMVLPNTPRFLRHGDNITISTKIANLSKKNLKGHAELQLFNAFTNKQIDLLTPPLLRGESPATRDRGVLPFDINTRGNTTVSWNLQIPDNIDAVTYRIVAKAGNFSDGEENGLAVLPNRMLVTETLPLPIRGGQTKKYVLDKLKNNNSSTLRHHKLTLEMTSNPAWYGVQALPYLMEYPYECAEQVFSRYYANTLASHIANSNPKIKQVFDTWRDYQPEALLSNLEKNEELKNIILQESPWVREAQSETEQKRRIALLFDMNKMGNEQRKALNKLKQMQMSSGGWPWFKGGRENRFISQHIVAGLGHLDNLDVAAVREDKSVWNMTKQALRYLDAELAEDYRRLKGRPKVKLDEKHIGYTQIHYFYTRSFFKDEAVRKEYKEAFDYYLGQLEKYYLNNGLYAEGMTALALHRYDKAGVPAKILKWLKERSIINEELGMYWKENTSSWFWYQAPIETQALMVEAFDEVGNDQTAVDDLKTWLLKHKQTNSWKTTKATSEAVYALLLRGGDWLAIDEVVDITVGKQKIDPSGMPDIKLEAGTGYFKTSWNGVEVSKDMAEVTISKSNDGVAWGGLYWQYFEDLDKITAFEDTPLKLNKKVFKQTNTDKGPQISEVKDGQKLAIGDLLKIRIELRVDRDMEFIHMKDMRAAGLEPTNVISQYKWQDGLGYYESTKDASTNFFIDYLPKGIYVFEYPLRVSHSGDFSNGITSIQSMYAPEFSSHSEGVRLVVE